jgi:hypothetical protein
MHEFPNTAIAVFGGAPEQLPGASAAAPEQPGPRQALHRAARGALQRARQHDLAAAHLRQEVHAQLCQKRSPKTPPATACASAAASAGTRPIAPCVDVPEMRSRRVVASTRAPPPPRYARRPSHRTDGGVARSGLLDSAAVAPSLVTAHRSRGQAPRGLASRSQRGLGDPASMRSSTG